MKTLFFLPLFAAASVLFAQPAQPNNLKSQPLLFLENKGQILDFDNQPRPDVLFMMRGKGVNVFVGKGELHYLFSSPMATPDKKLRQTMPEQDFPENPETQTDTTPTIYDTYRIDISLAGMNPNATVEALDKNAYYENYYNIPGHYQDGILNVRSFGKIRINNVYPNIDWLIYSKDGKLKHEFLLHPGARHQDIRLLVKGATNILVNEIGALEITTPLGTIVEDKPFIPENPEIQGSFSLHKTQDLEYEIGYELGGINEIKTDLTIDPGIEWSTYFGGNGYDYGNAVSASNDKVYFGGITESYNYISYKGYQASIGGSANDWFITQFSADGRRLWATYYGGLFKDVLLGLKAFKNGVIATGETLNSGLGYLGYDTSYSGGPNPDGLILLLDNSGARKWSTYYGDVGADRVFDAEVLIDGSFGFTGYTGSKGLATNGAYQSTNNGNYDGFLTVLDSVGALKWSTYFGGSALDICWTMASADSFIYIGGVTQSSSLISYMGFQNTKLAGSDGFIAKFNLNGDRIWGSYFGSSATEVIRDIAVFNASIYISCGTSGPSGMSYGNAYQKTGCSALSGVLARVETSGKLIWSTYLCDNQQQIARSVVVDKNGNIWWLLGNKGDSKFGSEMFYDKSFGSSHDGFLLVRFDTACQKIDGTFYHGFFDFPYLFDEFFPPFNMALAYDGMGAVYSNVTDDGSGFSTRSKYQADYKSYTDAFFVKWTLNNFSKPIVSTAKPYCQGTKLNITYAQYGVGRGSGVKTYLELSDTNGLFNGNTITLFTRNDTLSRFDTVNYTLSQSFPPGKKYRVRARMTYPPDTSESSDPFEIHRSPTGQLVPVSNTQMCMGDSIQIEIDTLGSNRVRWYYKSSPTPNAGDTNKSYYAKLSGKYYPVVTNPAGCAYATPGINITAWPNPKAAFYAIDSAACFNTNNFSFMDTSKPYVGDVITSFKWYFGDGQTSTNSDPSYSYSNPGTYIVKLGVGTQRGCHDTAYHTVHVWPEPNAKIHVNAALQCLRGNAFVFTDSTDIANDSISQIEWTNGTNVISTQQQFTKSFSSTGSYVIGMAVQTTHGCKDNTSKTIKVSSNPYAEIQSSKPGFCSGDSVKLEVANPNTWNYQWYESGNKINGQTKTIWYTRTAGNYAVRAANSDGCDTVSNAVKVTEFANPAPDLGADKTIRYDSAVTLNPGVFKTYQWNKGGITSTITVNKSNLDTGKNNIWVLVTDSNGCKGSDTVIVRLEPINGLDDPAMAGIRVYPIPAENILHVEIPNLLVALTSDDLSTSSNTYQMLSMDGRVALHGILKDKINSIDISEIASGTYLLELHISGKNYSLQLIK